PHRASLADTRSAGRGRARAQIAVVQDVSPGAVDAWLDRHAVFEPLAGGQPDRRASIADQQRSDRDMQAIQQAGFQEGGHGDAAAFDEYPPTAAGVQLLQQFLEIDPAAFGGDLQYVLSASSRLAHTSRVVSRGLSASTVRAPTTTASHSARSRCRCRMFSEPVT